MLDQHNTIKTDKSLKIKIHAPALPYSMERWIIVLCMFVKFGSTSKGDLRLAGAKDAEDHMYRYVVELRIHEQLFCTGAVLTQKATLTASHCLTSIPREYIPETFIRYTNANNQSKMATATDFCMFPTYTSTPTLQNDIAILKHENIVLPYYGKVSAVSAQSLYGQHCVIAGHGPLKEIVSNSLGLFPKKLQVLEGILISCVGSSKAFDNSNYPCVCVARKCGANIGAICGGDSGGPLIHASGIVAVSSMGFECDSSQARLAGIFTATSPYIKWIRQQISNDNGQSRKV